MGELMDWWAYYAYLNDADDKASPSDHDKIEFMSSMKEKYGA